MNITFECYSEGQMVKTKSIDSNLTHAVLRRAGMATKTSYNIKLAEVLGPKQESHPQ